MSSTFALTQRRRAVETVERRVLALNMRRAGATYATIGAALGIAENSALRLVQRALNAMQRESADGVRRMELERLDAMWAAAWPGIELGDPAAIRSGISIMERRAKLLGLDAPTQTQVAQISEVQVVFVDDPIAAPEPDATPDGDHA